VRPSGRSYNRTSMSMGLMSIPADIYQQSRAPVLSSTAPVQLACFLFAQRENQQIT